MLAERERRRQETLRAIVQQAKRDRRLSPDVVEAFAALHLQRDDGAPILAAAHHRLWLQFFCDWRIKQLLIIGPPETAKTTWILAYLGCKLGFYPESNTIIASSSGGVAEKRSLSLRTLVETDEWKETFPGIVTLKANAGGLKYYAEEWSLAPNGKPFPGRLHPTVSAYGKGGPVIGSRADEVVADDILDFKSTRSATQRETDKQWAHTSLLSRMKARVGRTVAIGNAWHPDDFYGASRRDGGWVVIHTPTLSEGPDVYAYISYPTDWPHERLGEPMGQAEVDKAMEALAA